MAVFQAAGERDCSLLIVSVILMSNFTKLQHGGPVQMYMASQGMFYLLVSHYICVGLIKIYLNKMVPSDCSHYVQTVMTRRDDGLGLSVSRGKDRHCYVCRTLHGEYARGPCVPGPWRRRSSPTALSSGSAGMLASHREGARSSTSVVMTPFLVTQMCIW